MWPYWQPTLREIWPTTGYLPPVNNIGWLVKYCAKHWLAGQILCQSCREIPILMESHLASCQPAREVQITTLAHFLVGQDFRDQNWGLSDYAMHSLLVLTWSFSLSLSSHSQYECKACVPKPVDTLTGVPAMALPFVQVLQECHTRCTWSSRCTLFDSLCWLYLPRFARSTLRIVSRLPGKISFKIAAKSLTVNNQI